MVKTDNTIVLRIGENLLKKKCYLFNYSKRLKKVVIARALARSNPYRGIASLSLAMTSTCQLI
ncbi:hypothetical protein BPIT_21370 [Candidatus Brocadia pituitae]|nr:hypothetical protein BPIT_21370 [Candidatus Brocadia pituitae]